MESGSMNGIPILDWFTGGETPYMNLVHCMNHDWFWIGTTVALDFSIAIGYAIIALHWRRNERSTPPSQAKNALSSMRNIFIFCGTCGYLFIPIKMYWPAWRLYDLFLAFLVYYTWKYVWKAKDLSVIYHEIERSAKLERELAATRVESERKSFFLNAISHDLRTPINGLVLQAHLADMSLEADDLEALREAIGSLKASAAATAETLGEFMELGRLGWDNSTNRLEPFAIDELVDRTARAFITTAKAAGLTFSIQAETHAHILSDRMKIDRILRNLIGNAIKYTHKGGVTISVFVKNRDLTIEVVDTGVGVAPEHRDRIFEEFYQVNNRERDRQKGFGLGLPISRRLAEQLGGSIVLDGDLDRGSRFSVVLPGVVIPQEHPAPHHIYGDATNRGGRTDEKIGAPR
jgi:signal transduction histidine kinase